MSLSPSYNFCTVYNPSARSSGRQVTAWHGPFNPFLFSTCRRLCVLVKITVHFVYFVLFFMQNLSWHLFSTYLFWKAEALRECIMANA